MDTLELNKTISLEGRRTKAAVYALEHTASGRRLILSTRNLSKRLYDQRRSLAKGTHHNAAIDADLREQGASAFRIVLLELVDDPALLPTLKRQHVEHAYQTCGTYNQPSASVVDVPIDVAAAQAVAEARRRSTAIAVDNALAGLERLRENIQQAWRAPSDPLHHPQHYA